MVWFKLKEKKVVFPRSWGKRRRRGEGEKGEKEEEEEEEEEKESRRKKKEEEDLQSIGLHLKNKRKIRL